MAFLKIVVLAIVQGLAELLPVSSSAHVVVAEKLMGLDPSAPALTWLLVMLHTGTMFAVIVYFWPRWKRLFQNHKNLGEFYRAIVIATVVTGVLEFGLKIIIGKVVFEHFLYHSKGEVENLFRVLPLMA